MGIGDKFRKAFSKSKTTESVSKPSTTNYAQQIQDEYDSSVERRKESNAILNNVIKSSPKVSQIQQDVVQEMGSEIADKVEYDKFVEVCETASEFFPEEINNDVSKREMFDRFKALKDLNRIAASNILLFPFALEAELRKSENPSKTLSEFMSKKIGDVTIRDAINIKEIYSAALVAESIGLVQDHKKLFTVMYDPQMQDAVSNEIGQYTFYHPLDDRIAHLSLVANQGAMERKGLKVKDFTSKGIDKGVGTEEVQQAKSAIRTAMLSRDPNKEDRNVK